MSTRWDREIDTGGFGKATRREALKAMGLTAAAGAPFLTSLLAAGVAGAQSAPDYKALVCVALFGGNDQSNTVVPREGDAYRDYESARPSLAIASGALLPIAPIGFAGPALGLSPHLPGLRRLFEDGDAAILANVGPLVAPVTRQQYRDELRPLPLQLFSHSDQQRAWETGLPDRASRTGWLGRMGDLIAPVFNPNSEISIAMSVAGNNAIQAGIDTVQYQLTTRGPVRIGALDRLYSSQAAGQALMTLITQSRTHLLEAAHNTITARGIASEGVVSAALAAAPPLSTVFPSGRLGGQAAMVAQMICARSELSQRRQIFLISSGGWDFHDNLLEEQAERLLELDAAISALHAATVEMGVADQVATFTMSDFGRALNFNGRGSDHGWGGHHFIVGGGVQGRRIFGQFPTVALDGPEDAGQGRLIPTTSVDEYAATLGRWFGAAADDLTTIMPNLNNFANPNLGFMG